MKNIIFIKYTRYGGDNNAPFYNPTGRPTSARDTKPHNFSRDKIQLSGVCRVLIVIDLGYHFLLLLMLLYYRIYTLLKIKRHFLSWSCHSCYVFPAQRYVATCFHGYQGSPNTTGADFHSLILKETEQIYNVSGKLIRGLCPFLRKRHLIQSTSALPLVFDVIR